MGTPSYPFENLRAWIEWLDAKGELVRVTAPVDRDLEITEIADRVSKSPGGGKALLFTNVKGSAMPVLINAFGSERRMASVGGVERFEELGAKTEEVLSFFDKAPRTFMQKLGMLPKLKDLSNFFPKEVSKAPCQEVVLDPPSIASLPIIRCWPQDPAPFITMPAVITRSPHTNKRNVGMYRMQVFDERTTGMHWHRHHHGATHHQMNKEKGVARTEVAVALGCDPATTFSAAAPLPDDLDELMFAGFLRGDPVRIVKCKTVDLEVPAEAEIVLEGYVETGELRREGPFGDHTGYYSLADNYPVFHITCVTHRKNPIYQTTVVGRPPMEDCWMGGAIEHLFLPILKRQFPEIVDMHMPYEGVFHNLVLIRLHKRYPAHARKIMHGIWGLGQAMFSKVIVVVDHDVNIRDYREVTWKALNHIDPQRDTEFVLGPVETLDHASRLPWLGSKMGVDATRKWKEEGFTREWPDEIVMDAAVKERVTKRWAELFPSAPGARP